MNFHCSRHVEEEMEKRRISRTFLDGALKAPEQKVPEVKNITCFQSRVERDGKRYLLRVMVDETVHPSVVVTAYLTTKINKYWRKP